MASADFLQFVVTAASEPNLPPSARPPLVLTHSFSPCNCLIYWQRFRTAIGREIVWHPCPRCLPYEIPVRQFRDLPAPSFRFHLAVDTLGVRLYPSRCRADSGLSPVGTCARRAHQKKTPALGLVSVNLPMSQSQRRTVPMQMPDLSLSVPAMEHLSGFTQSSTVPPASA